MVLLPAQEYILEPAWSPTPLRASYAKSGTEYRIVSRAVLPPYARPTPCPVLTQRIVLQTVTPPATLPPAWYWHSCS
eukprot:3046598-Rhodomonas_salina.1